MTAGRKVILCTLTVALTVGLALPASATTNRINGVQVSSQGDSTVVEIAGERAPNFTTFKQDQPRRVIIDVAECSLGRVPTRIQGDGSLVEGVTTAQYGSSPNGISRVIIGLSREAEYRVTTRGGSLFVHLSPGSGGLLVSAGVPVAPQRPSAVHRDDLDLPLNMTPPADADREHAAPSAVDPVAEAEAKPVEEAEAVAAAPQEEPADAPAEPVVVAMATPAPTPAREDDPAPALVPPPAETVVAQDEGDEVEGDEGDDIPVAEEIGEVEEEPPPPPPADEVEEVPAAAEPPPADEVPAADEGGMGDEGGMEDEGSVDVPVSPEVDEPPAAVEEVPPPPPVEEDDGGDVVEEVPAAPEYSEVADRVEVSGAMKDMTWVGFQQTMDASRVFIKTNEPVRYHVTEEGDNLVVLELENTRIPVRNNTRFLDTHFFDTAVTLITPREIEGVSRNVRIEIQLKDRVPYRAGQDENMVFINFQRP